MAVREIISIDEELCDGCGLCVPSCSEGAIQVIDGKARLVGENLCDGLGDCLGECPRGALTIVRREAEDFDESAVREHLARGTDARRGGAASPEVLPQGGLGCPSTRQVLFDTAPSRATAPSEPGRVDVSEPSPSALGHWPVKLFLVAPRAPFLRDAELLLLADCVPVAFADTHRELLPDKAVVIGCPKFDDYHMGLSRLTDIIRDGGILSLTVVHMEVPCCFGFMKMAEDALAASGRDIPLGELVVTARGDLIRPGEDDPVIPHLTVQRPAR